MFNNTVFTVIISRNVLVLLLFFKSLLWVMLGIGAGVISSGPWEWGLCSARN